MNCDFKLQLNLMPRILYILIILISCNIYYIY